MHCHLRSPVPSVVPGFTHELSRPVMHSHTSSIIELLMTRQIFTGPFLDWLPDIQAFLLRLLCRSQLICVINLQATRAYNLGSWLNHSRRLLSLEMLRYWRVPLNLTRLSYSGHSTVEHCLIRVDDEDVAATTMTMMSALRWEDVAYQHITDLLATSTVYTSQRSTCPNTKESTIVWWRRRRGRCLADQRHSNPQVCLIFLRFRRLWLRLQSWLMPQSPHRLRNDLKCVEWDVKPCEIQSLDFVFMHFQSCPWVI